MSLIRTVANTATGLKIDDPISMSGVMFLGCTFHKQKRTFPSGGVITSTSHGMEEFFKACGDVYQDLANS